jgi:hypothetical protein
MSYTAEEIHQYTIDYIEGEFRDRHPFDLPPEVKNRMAHILGAVLDAVREDSRLTKRWSQPQYYGKADELSHFVDSQMEKTGARCQLTVYAGSVSMDFTLPHVDELPSMDNNFWSRLASSIELQSLTYFSDSNLENQSRTNSNKNISKFVKAPLFAFLTEFHIAYQQDPERIALGRFEKSIFYYDSSWPEIIESFTAFFTAFSKLSQALYRSYYIKASRDPKRMLAVANYETVREIFSWMMQQTNGWNPADVLAAFPKAKAIDIRAAHEIALERGTISNAGKKPLHSFVTKRKTPET